MRRDLQELREGDRNPCVVLSGVLLDPYTGKRLPYTYRRASQIQTHHVVALGAAWRGGAYAWTPQRRLEYANDLDVLLAVEKQTNYGKGSRTADKWKPPLTTYWCAYARRYTGIKARYRLSVTAPEKLALRRCWPPAPSARPPRRGCAWPGAGRRCPSPGPGSRSVRRTSRPRRR
ncbi:HNH endonuclease family protein [Streptomyces sp. NPDC058611]|uniref:HNH endonuclease family protein n=1 Tax=unclassified Streptomyces TaxID=2593676 RepID=UPI00364A8081